MTAHDRILGALMGVAYGDAMGMPSEFFTRKQIKERLGWIDGLLPGHPQSMISHGFPAGSVTDDTMITLLVARILIETSGEVDPKLLIRRIQEWAASDDKSRSVIGPSTRAAFEKIESGVPMDEAGKAGTTNGAAMKISPIGMITHPDDMEGLTRRVRMLCLPTHNTGAAIGGAMAVAMAVSYAVAGGDCLDELIKRAVEAARMGERQGHEVVSASVSARIKCACALVKQGGSNAECLDMIYDLIGAGLASAESVPAAFAVMLLSKGDPLLCARLGANLGGDTDTIASMATAICGALAGSCAFPAHDIKRIEQVNGIKLDRLAAGLAQLRP